MISFGRGRSIIIKLVFCDGRLTLEDGNYQSWRLEVREEAVGAGGGGNGGGRCLCGTVVVFAEVSYGLLVFEAVKRAMTLRS